MNRPRAKAARNLNLIIPLVLTGGLMELPCKACGFTRPPNLWVARLSVKNRLPLVPGTIMQAALAGGS